MEAEPSVPWIDAIVAAHTRYARASKELAETVASALESSGLTPAEMRRLLKRELGVFGSTANALTEVAVRSDELPDTMAALDEGTISFDHATTIARYTHAADEAEVVVAAQSHSAAELRQIVRDIEPPSDEAVADQQDLMETNWYGDPGTGWWEMRARLPLADGMVVEKALERANSKLTHIHAASGAWPAPLVRNSLALLELAGQHIQSDRNAALATVVLHVTEPDTAKQVTMIEHGPTISISQSDRLSCDARTCTVTHDRVGKVIGIGRTSRVIPHWLRRLVRFRDGGCKFPGCGNTYNTHIHHIRHWLRGGPTDLGNLITLCGAHHRQLHDEGWSLHGDPDEPETLVWITPSGFEHVPARVLAATANGPP